MAKAGPINRESAENLAISALAFLAGVLDHVVSDDALLTAVAAHAGVSPLTIERAQAVLSGQPWEREVP